MRRVVRVLALIVGGLVLLCGVACALSALSNRNLPTGPEVLDRLAPLDKARLAETLHLKQALGEAAWPGWGQADVPIILWNHPIIVNSLPTHKTSPCRLATVGQPAWPPSGKPMSS